MGMSDRPVRRQTRRMPMSLAVEDAAPLAEPRERRPAALWIDGPRAARGIRVMLADGHSLVRAALRMLLEREAGISVVAEAATGIEAVASARRARPHVVVVDAGLPGGVEVTRELAALPGSCVVVMVRGADDPAVFPALRAGASGVVERDAEPADLMRALNALASGGAVLSPPVARRVLARFVARPERDRPSPDGLEELTPREREVMALAARGLSNDEIAAHLAVSAATVKTHLNRAMAKLRARDRAQLVAFAYESGLVPMPGAAA
jgi:DNA-binding NarL/FixJ family response regulator